ncbi:hypothetical protein [Diaphorobacter aerolatus]|uniref:Uncharacterized protein n=1 Tax=Diaphorobacter aerolatus TaxID=1288495 RepID=A0A7H0GIN6_9BURK|nr:hypothetical protein [Diaphorobacter aerolatus]QNP48152.1 hypothetical protein H9K75_19250 [Diaphorobacter aerolatus]
MSRATLAGIALTQIKEIREPTAEVATHLDPIELALLDAFKEWQPFVVRTPRSKFSWQAMADGGATLSFTQESDPIEAIFADPKDEAKLQDLVGDNLKALHGSLGKLIQQWESRRNPDQVKPSSPHPSPPPDFLET